MQLGWVDFSKEDREKVLDVLSMLQGKSGSRDSRSWFPIGASEKIRKSRSSGLCPCTP